MLVSVSTYHTDWHGKNRLWGLSIKGDARKEKKMGTEEGQIETPSECKVIPTQKHQKICVSKGWSLCEWEVKNISNKYG